MKNIKNLPILKNFLIIFFFFWVLSFANAQTACDNYCSDGIAYSNGYYDTGLQRCGYSSQTTCSSGCNTAGTACNADCTDSDGDNLYSKGTVTGWDYYKTSKITVNDSCTTRDGGAETTSGAWVVEEKCDSAQKAHAYYYQCPTNYTCSDGKCIQQTTTQCTDTDGSDIYTKGTVTGLDYYGTSTITSSDYCTDRDGGAQLTTGNWIAEEQCDSQNKTHAYYYQCPTNYTCSDGKCIQQTTTSNTTSCTDFCENGILYSRGSYDTGLQKCSFIQTNCSNGCNSSGTACNASIEIVQTECRDYCENGTHYFNGYFERNLNKCVYFSKTCDFGCNSNSNACRINSECPDFCRNGLLKYNGYYNERLRQCEYDPYSCGGECDSTGTKCEIVDLSCPDKCRNNMFYHNGSYDTRLFQCDYERDSCRNGCNSNATACAATDENAVISPTTEPTTDATLSCEDYCSNGIFYGRGAFNRALQSCSYNRTTCSNGCNARGTACAVVQQTTSCFDPDGRDIYRQTAAAGLDASRLNVVEVEDSCTDVYGGAETSSGKWIVEEQCDSDNRIHAYYYECPTTGGCVEGKCVGDRIPLQTTTDDYYGSNSNRVRGMESRNLAMTSSDGSRQVLQIQNSEDTQMEVSNQTVILRRGNQEFKFEKNFTKLARMYVRTNERLDNVLLSVENDQPIYQVSKSRKGMALGIIPVELPVLAKINATTLTQIGEIKPWWSFLVSENAGELVPFDGIEPGTITTGEIPEGEIQTTNVPEIQTKGNCEINKEDGSLLCPDDEGTVADFETIEGTELDETVGVEKLDLADSKNSTAEVKTIENNPKKEKITKTVKVPSNRSTFPKLDKTLVSMMNFVENNCLENSTNALCPGEKIYSIAGFNKNTQIEVKIELNSENKNFRNQFSSLGGTVTYFNSDKKVLHGTIGLGKLKELHSISDVKRVSRKFNEKELWDLDDDAINFVKLDHLKSVGQDGNNVKIVVMDIGFNGYLNSQTNGNLPAANKLHYENFIDTADNVKDHGRKVAETVYAIAPEAELFLYRVNGYEAWEDAIDEAIDNDADILTSSIGYEAYCSGNGNGWFEDLVKKATDAGILFFQAAGNEQNQFYHVKSDGGGDEWVDLKNDDETNSIDLLKDDKLSVEMRYDQWGEDGHGDAEDDYDLYVFMENDDGELEELVSSTNDNSEPYEWVEFTAPKDGKYRIAIKEFDKESNGKVSFSLYFSKTGAEYVSDGKEIVCPASSPDAITVGAVHEFGVLAGYSSRGPTMDGRVKPDFSAPSGFVLQAGGGAISGTSFSTPFLAASAAVLGKIDFTKHAEIYKIFKYMTFYNDKDMDDSFGWGVPNYDKTFNNVSCKTYKVKTGGAKKVNCNKYPVYVRKTAKVSLKFQKDTFKWNGLANESKTLTLTDGTKLLLEYPKWHGLYLSTTGKGQKKVFDVVPQEGDSDITKNMGESGIIKYGLYKKTGENGEQKLTISITNN